MPPEPLCRAAPAAACYCSAACQSRWALLQHGWGKPARPALTLPLGDSRHGARARVLRRGWELRALGSPVARSRVCLVGVLPFQPSSPHKVLCGLNGDELVARVLRGLGQQVTPWAGPEAMRRPGGEAWQVPVADVVWGGLRRGGGPVATVLLLPCPQALSRGGGGPSTVWRQAAVGPRGKCISWPSVQPAVAPGRQSLAGGEPGAVVLLLREPGACRKPRCPTRDSISGGWRPRHLLGKLKGVFSG